jgi:hypothetical protein
MNKENKSMLEAMKLIIDKTAVKKTIKTENR